MSNERCYGYTYVCLASPCAQELDLAGPQMLMQTAPTRTLAMQILLCVFVLFPSMSEQGLHNPVSSSSASWTGGERSLLFWEPSQVINLNPFTCPYCPRICSLLSPSTCAPRPQMPPPSFRKWRQADLQGIEGKLRFATAVSLGVASVLSENTAKKGLGHIRCSGMGIRLVWGLQRVMETMRNSHAHITSMLLDSLMEIAASRNRRVVHTLQSRESLAFHVSGRACR